MEPVSHILNAAASGLMDFMHVSQKFERLLDEATGNLAPEVLFTLSPEKTYGIQWYNRQKSETVYGPDGQRYVIRERPRSEWMAVLVEDAGVPAPWVEAARESGSGTTSGRPTLAAACGR